MRNLEETDDLQICSMRQASPKVKTEKGPPTFSKQMPKKPESEFQIYMRLKGNDLARKFTKDQNISLKEAQKMVQQMYDILPPQKKTAFQKEYKK